jgi:hypothetical protein
MSNNPKVNVNLIPFTSNKTKSTSNATKQQNNSNNPVLLKLIDRTKVNGYM